VPDLAHPGAGGSFLVLGTGLPFEGHLAGALASHGPTGWVELGVSRRRSGETDVSAAPPLVWRYPPGFNGSLAAAFTPFVRARLDRERRRLRTAAGSPTLITAYARFAPYVTRLRRAEVVYYNQDDNARWQDGHRVELECEARLAASAGTLVCASRYQADRFRERFPDRAGDVFHLPHGVPEAAINLDPAGPGAGRVVAIAGTLSGRYDWALIDDVVSSLPDVRFVFVGDISLDDSGREGWQDRMRGVLARRNVDRLPLPAGGDEARARPLWNGAAVWLPYDMTLPFNVASCPLKLFTGLGSGRPIVSAAVPECRLYPEWVQVYEDAGEAAALLRRALDAAASPAAAARAAAQVAFARTETWDTRAARLVGILRRTVVNGRVRDQAGAALQPC